MKRMQQLILAGVLGLSLAACGSPAGPAKVSGSEAPSTPDAVVNTASDLPVSYTAQAFEDKYYHFQLLLPVMQNSDYVGTSYCIQRGGDGDDRALLAIAHYNEIQDEGKYDTAQFDTPAHALTELEQGKLDRVFSATYDASVLDTDYTTTDCQIAGLDAVRYEGTYTLEDSSGKDRVVGVVGYCILGKYTPVFFCALDLSQGQDQLAGLAEIIDEMAQTYVDGTGM